MACTLPSHTRSPQLRTSHRPCMPPRARMPPRHACPQPCMPQPRMPPPHTPPGMHTPQPCPQARTHPQDMHTPQPRMPPWPRMPLGHVCPPPSMHATPWPCTPPVDRITDACENITLPNFVAGGNEQESSKPS